MINLTQVLLGFALSLVASVTSAIVTVRLSLGRFRSEQWWEKKAETYSRLIEELAIFQIHAEESQLELGLLTQGIMSSSEGPGELGKQARTARDSIKKTTAIGAYIISDAAADALSVFRKALDKAEGIAFEGNPTDWLEANEIELDAAKACIVVLRECAKSDLRSP